MRITHLLAGLTLAVAVGACSEEPTVPVGGESITLSATQAASLVASVESFGSTDPSLAALADTVDAVLQAGAEARRIEVTTDLGTNVFYAVTLHRAHNSGTPHWSTFHLIAFDSPTAPQHFIILGGYASNDEAAPQSVSGPIGGAATVSLTGHLFTLSGGQLSQWHASAGNVAFSSMEILEQCAAVGTSQCARGLMDVTFSITQTVAGNSTTGQRTASGTVTEVPGIRLSF